MKAVFKILGYFAGVLLLGCILAPVLYWTAHGWLEQWALANGLMKWDPHGDQVIVRGPLAFLESDFSKIFNRSMLVAALLLLWPTLRSLKIGGWKGLGLFPDPRAREHLVRGLLIGGGLVACMAAGYIFLRIYHWKPSLPWTELPRLALSAAVVGCLEEAVFRGAIMGLFLRAMRPYSALFWTTAIFAILHFLKPDEDVVVKHVTWLSGFQLLPHAFHQFAEPAMLLAGFSTIFVLGWLLGYARLRTQSLWMSIGLHAGVVFVKMSFSKFTKRDAEFLPWVGPELQIGLVPVIILLAALVIVWRRMEYEDLLPAPKSRG